MATSTADEGRQNDLDAAHEEIRHLHRALSSRAVIDQAKGMLMARHGCTADEAFELLAAASQRSNRRLAELARAIVEQARRPPPPRNGGLPVGLTRQHGMNSDAVQHVAELTQQEPARREQDSRLDDVLPEDGSQGNRRADVGRVDVESLLALALERDQRAERRDRDAEGRDLAAERRSQGCPECSGHAAADRQQAAVDRVHAGADRDESAADRAEMLQGRQGSRRP